MNETEHLLVCLSEEAAEVQQAVAKALRFGLEDGYPGTDRKNSQDIANEVCDLLAVVELLVNRNAISSPYHPQKIAVKKAAVEEFMQYAAQRGTLITDDINSTH